MSFTTEPDQKAPHLDVNRDTGYFVRALTQLPPGKTGHDRCHVVHLARSGSRSGITWWVNPMSRTSKSPSTNLIGRFPVGSVGKLASCLSIRRKRVTTEVVLRS